MAKCECCNNLGSSPKFQFVLSIAVLLLFIVVGVYGIAIINLMNMPLYGYGEYNWDFLSTSLELAYWFGSVVSVLWLIALCSRCCAPCCCELSDVPHPCSPCCQTWHLLDVPFFLGVDIALFPVNTHHQQSYNPQLHENPELADFFFSEEFYRFQDVTHILGLVLLLLAIPSGFAKWRKMTQKTSYRSDRSGRMGGWGPDGATTVGGSADGGESCDS
eukprot:Skav202924  [mRNA]  locus=scaffold1565:280297:281438:- [translate_table: standard]